MKVLLTYGSYFGDNKYQYNFIYNQNDEYNKEKIYELFNNDILSKYGPNSNRVKNDNKEAMRPYLVNDDGSIVNSLNYYNSHIIGGVNIPDDIVNKVTKEFIEDYEVPITINGNTFDGFDNSKIDKEISSLRIKANLYEYQNQYKLNFVYSNDNQKEYIKKVFNNINKKDLKLEIENNIIKSCTFLKSRNDLLDRFINVDGIIINNGGMIMKDMNNKDLDLENMTSTELKDVLKNILEKEKSTLKEAKKSDEKVERETNKLNDLESRVDDYLNKDNSTLINEINKIEEENNELDEIIKKSR